VPTVKRKTDRLFDSNTGRFLVQCVIPTFNQAGGEVGEVTCSTWVPVGK
jgi:hypothetical protein